MKTSHTTILNLLYTRSGTINESSMLVKQVVHNFVSVLLSDEFFCQWSALSHHLFSFS